VTGFTWNKNWIKCNFITKITVNDLSKHGKAAQLTGAICAVIALFSFVHPAQATYAYLPTVGTPALRMEGVTTNSFNFLAFSRALSALEAKTAETVSNAANLATAAAANTNKVNNSGAISSTTPASAAPVTGTGNSPFSANNPADIHLEAVSGGANNSQRPYNFAFPPSTASDLLTVTPQMITQYLKPDSNETNQLDRPGVVVFVPADMPFMPPTSKTAPESRAIYQSR
jgi:hypothetical protein